MEWYGHVNKCIMKFTGYIILWIDKLKPGAECAKPRIETNSLQLGWPMSSSGMR